MNKIDTFWNEFLEQTKRDTNTLYMEAFYFELSEYWANELLRLVLDGRKRATTSSLESFNRQGHRMPRPKDLSIVTDWRSNRS